MRCLYEDRVTRQITPERYDTMAIETSAGIEIHYRAYRSNGYALDVHPKIYGQGKILYGDAKTDTRTAAGIYPQD